MMNEKRFTLLNHPLVEKSVYDALEDDVYDIRKCVALLNNLYDENEQLRKELYESEKHYLIETSDISDKPYLEEELSELKKKYGVIDDKSD